VNEGLSEGFLMKHHLGQGNTSFRCVRHSDFSHARQRLPEQGRVDVVAGTPLMKSLLAVAATLLSLSLVTGCDTMRSTSSGPTPAAMSVEASSRDIVVGETVTLVARTKDTYGRDATVKWSSTAGSVGTEQDGRVARVRFNEVGTYTVRGALFVDGREVDSDLVEIRVRPVS